MQDKIREMYQELYNEKFELLKEKNEEVIQEETSNNDSIAKAIILRVILGKIILPVISTIVVYIFVKFFMSNMTPNNNPGKESLTLFFYFIIPATFIICLISFIYQIIIKPKRSIQRNYWVKKSVDNKVAYNDVFCEQICKPIIETVIPNIEYDHSNGISKELYEDMGFSNVHDAFSSTDKIKVINNSNLEISKVHTKFKDGGASGYWYTTLFCGIASIETIPSKMLHYIKIRNKKVDSIKLKKSVPVDNEELNQFYEIETDDLGFFNKCFSDEILNYLIELAKRNQNIEINILENHICIRLHDKGFLDFNVQNENNEEKIISNCNSIDTIIKINNILLKELRNNNIF